MGFASGFRVGWDSVSEAMKERERKEMLKGVRGVLDDKPVQSQGYTAEQGQDLEAAAARGDKIDIVYKDDGKGNKVFDRYVVTPGPNSAVSDPSVMSRDVSMQGVTDFLGNRTAGNLSDRQVQSMRAMALADAVGKHDPIRGVEMKRQAEADERARVKQEKDDARQAEQDARQQVVNQQNDAEFAQRQQGWKSTEDMRAAVRAATSATPEQSTGFTADQGRMLEDAAAKGAKITFDDASRSYVINPADGSAPVRVGMQAVTDFMGNRSAGELKPEQVASMRNQAVVNAVTPVDPVQGFNMSQSIAQNAMTAKRNAREEEGWKREDEYKAKRAEILAGGSIAQTQKANADARTAYEQQLAQFKAAVDGGGNQSRLAAPSAPQETRPTIGQVMDDYSRLIRLDAEYGKISTEGLMQFGERLNKVKKEGYLDAMRSAQANAPIASVIEKYNSVGEAKVKIEDVVSDQMRPGPDGVPRRVIRFRNGTTIDALAELNSLGEAQKVYDLFYKAKADKREDAKADRALVEGNTTGRVDGDKLDKQLKELFQTEDDAGRKTLNSTGFAFTRQLALRMPQAAGGDATGAALAAHALYTNALKKAGGDHDKAVQTIKEQLNPSPAPNPSPNPNPGAPGGNPPSPQVDRPMSDFEARKQRAIQEEAERRKLQADAERARREQERLRLLQGRPDLQQMGGGRYFN